MMEVPQGYKCKDQIGKFKCIRRVYSSPAECQKYCVKDCKKEKCA